MRRPAFPSSLLWALIFSLAFMQPWLPLLGYAAVPTDLLFLALVPAWLWALGAGRTRFEWDRSFWWLIALFAAALASAAASDSPARSAPALLKQLYLLVLPVLVVNLVRTGEDLRTAIRCWLAGSAIVALVGIASLAAFVVDPGNRLLDYTIFHFGTLPPGDYPRLRLTFANANMACNYLAVSAMLLLVARRLGWVGRTPFRWLLAGIAVSAAFTISPGLGGIALAIGAWTWLLERERRPVLAKAALGGGLVAALAFLAGAAVTPILHPTAPFSIHVPVFGIELAPAGRLMTWADALRNLLADPLLGRGIGMDAVQVRYRSPSGDLQILTDAHNSFLNFAVQCGLAGLAALAAIVALGWRRSLPLRIMAEDRNVVRLGLGIAWLSAFAYQGLTGSFEDSRHLWVLFGLLIAANRIETGGTRHEMHPANSLANRSPGENPQ